MSNSNRDPKNLPPDDFGMTTPGINIPKDNYLDQKDDPADDWGKTNYNFSPKQSPSSRQQQPPPADNWGKTSAGINVPRSQPDDFSKTHIPGQSSGGGGGRDSDWGATQANINIPRQSIDSDDYGQAPVDGATSPYFQLPESERAKYQNVPPQQQQQQQQRQSQSVPVNTSAAVAAASASPKTERVVEGKKGGSSWLWPSLGILGMFLFAVAVLALVYFWFIPTSSFELTVKGAPPGSDIFVDGERWSLTSADSAYRLPGLKAGLQRNIEIKNPRYTCNPQTVTGENGIPKEIVAQCKENAAPVVVKNDDCQNIKKGEFAKAAKCANDALDNLKDPISVDDLLRAMNLYIINFPSGDYHIVKPEDIAFIKKAAGYIQKLPPNVVIEAGGHTDNKGSKQQNQKLSEDRANAVRTALIAAGAKDSALVPKGYGDTKPKPGNTNANDDERFQNRRIEYSVASK